jgi:orotidine-5'-phosphate decarboxylase
VSVLTSLDDAELCALGVGRSAADQVDAMAALAEDAGAPGLVLAAGEAARVRAAHPGLFLATPGIRPASLDGDDQRRTGTPAAAIAAGSDLLVLARAVCDVGDPRAALLDVLAQIQGAMV